MRVGVPFPLKRKSLLATTGVLVPLLAGLNFVMWFYGLYPSLGNLLAEHGVVLPDIDGSVLAAYTFWIQNITLSAAILLIALAVADIHASSVTRRIVRLIDMAECFEDGRFDIPQYAGASYTGANHAGASYELEKNMARMGQSLALMLRFVNTNVINLARKNIYSSFAESSQVTLAVFRIDNYHILARLIQPNQTNELANEFLARIIPPITKTGGAVNKIWTIDDFYVLAVWGNSSLTPNLKKDAAAALRACILVRARVKTMNHDMRIRAERTGNRYYPHFKVSMGLDSGEVFAGPVGTRERKEYGIMGETVQNAIFCAQIGAKTGTPIVMTKRTFDLGGDQFVTREVPGQDAAYFSLVKPVIGAEYAVP